ncbi:MAG: DUF4259 domain-containing protein [Chryseobacterium sp.]|jgi:hypothetical protein|uniref:DUF4259 domain-containing protein n=1 Tax=Chryseobacterium sp. TaxID=1871047 RepID=UPI00281AC920|nr:DUF4259 domain-containing protein [Chryseobacterium sp.]MDR2234941.1 DUF4259 domain-containing protein [Chryseobacterium sp.]
MGAWGYKALESDEGLDLVDFVRDYVETKYPGNEPVGLKLSELKDSLKEAGFFGETFSDGDFFYDHSAMALSELYLMFKETGELNYPYEDDENRDLKKRVKSFTGDQSSFEFLLRYLTDIINEVPDQDGEREIVELWKDSDMYSEWQENLTHLIHGLEAEK